MNLGTIDLRLAAIDVPKPEKARAGGVQPIFWGKQHGFMPQVLELIAKSPTASAMLARRAQFVAGEGFKIDKERLPGLAEFAKKCASRGKYRTLNKLLKRLSKDYSKLRGIALQLIPSKDGQHIAEIYHQRFETVAPAPMDENGDVPSYFICRDWSNTTKNPVSELPAFSPEGLKAKKPMLFYYYEEDAGVEYFPRLDYGAALNYMELEALLSEFHVSNVDNHFALGNILLLHKGPEATMGDDGAITATAEENRRKFNEGFKKNFTGPRAQKFLTLFGDGTAEGAEKMAKLLSFGANNSDTLYDTYNDLAAQKILSAGQVTSPAVVGLPTSGGLSDGSKDREAYEMYFNAVCRPDQLALLDVFRELLAYVAGVSFDGEDEKKPWLEITTTLPVKFTFSEATLELICTDDELRAMIDLDPLPAGAQTAKTTPAEPAGNFPG